MIGPSPSANSRRGPSVQGQQNVGEDDGGVEGKPVNGLQVTCAANSGVLQSSRIECFSRNRRYSIMYRPAWRMNQTGVQSTGSRRHAFKNRSFIVGRIVEGQSEQSQTI